MVPAEKEKKLNTEELEKKLEECEKLKDEYLANWKRATADMINYQKDEIKRIQEVIKFADATMLLKILPILDSFDLAEKKIPEDMKKDETVKGFLQIKNQLLEFLENRGVEAMETLGKKFDPNFHEAVEEIEQKGKEPGTIIEEIQKGYKINNGLLRPAKVRVIK